MLSLIKQQNKRKHEPLIMSELVDSLVTQQCIFKKNKLKRLSLQTALIAVYHHGAQQRGDRSEKRGFYL